MHAIAAKAVCFKEALEPEFKSYQAQVLKNANSMCQVFQERGVEIVSNGTKNHMFLVDLINKDVTGKAVEETLGRANITLNKNQGSTTRRIVEQLVISLSNSSHRSATRHIVEQLVVSLSISSYCSATRHIALSICERYLGEKKYIRGISGVYPPLSHPLRGPYGIVDRHRASISKNGECSAWERLLTCNEVGIG